MLASSPASGEIAAHLQSSAVGQRGSEGKERGTMVLLTGSMGSEKKRPKSVKNKVYTFCSMRNNILFT